MNGISKKLNEAIDNLNSYVIKEAKVTDYIDPDRLGEIVISNPILKTFKDCEPIENMILKMTGDMGISYYKVIKNDDDQFEAYLISKDGKQLGDPFLLDSSDLNEDNVEQLDNEKAEVFKSYLEFVKDLDIPYPTFIQLLKGHAKELGLEREFLQILNNTLQSLKDVK